MATVYPAGYNSYNVHLTEKEHQSLIDAALNEGVTRAQVLQTLITEHMRLLQSINRLMAERPCPF